MRKKNVNAKITNNGIYRLVTRPNRFVFDSVSPFASVDMRAGYDSMKGKETHIPPHIQV